MSMTRAEALIQASKDPSRTVVYVREDGDLYIAEWGGEEYSAGNPFGLDSKLSDAGVPQPRALYLVSDY